MFKILVLSVTHGASLGGLINPPPTALQYPSLSSQGARFNIWLQQISTNLPFFPHWNEGFYLLDVFFPISEAERKINRVTELCIIGCNTISVNCTHCMASWLLKRSISRSHCFPLLGKLLVFVFVFVFFIAIVSQTERKREPFFSCREHLLLPAGASLTIPHGLSSTFHISFYFTPAPNWIFSKVCWLGL